MHVDPYLDPSTANQKRQGQGKTPRDDTRKKTWVETELHFCMTHEWDYKSSQ